ncbi:MAG: ATP-binding protein [Bacteriovoracaceae bacterium]|nr:ATP-binding protein [Bacteriovoracaceae bacterium]
MGKHMSDICKAHLHCACKNVEHETRRIVITGGPGAGKTAVLEIARKNFCEHIAILPEAASILFGGGFPRGESFPMKKASQRAIFHIQRELEQIIEDEKKSAITLCDRGTIDGLAYWPDSEAQFWKDVGTSKEKELARYAAVIHMRSPSLDKGYNHQNPIRTETALEATAADLKIEHAWDGHPHRYFVASENDFLSKVALAIKLIKKHLPECCQSHEIEELKKQE